MREVVDLCCLFLLQIVAKLVGWKDTKRTGRVSVKVLWQGWRFNLAFSAAKELSRSDVDAFFYASLHHA